MLENPYYTAQPDIPYDPGVYRGEGRIEESPDGSSIVVRWESTFEEGVAAQWERQKQVGTTKSVRLAQIIYSAIGLFCFLFVAIFSFQWQYQAIMLIIGAGLIITVILLPLYYRRMVKKIVMSLRGTRGVVDTVLTIDSSGVHTEAQDTVSTIRWRGISDLVIAKGYLNFVRQPAGVMYVPLRVFPDSGTLDRFVALAQEYQKRRPA